MCLKTRSLASLLKIKAQHVSIRHAAMRLYPLFCSLGELFAGLTHFYLLIECSAPTPSSIIPFLYKLSLEASTNSVG